jgi:hypothetical protein
MPLPLRVAGCRARLRSVAAAGAACVGSLLLAACGEVPATAPGGVPAKAPVAAVDAGPVRLPLRIAPDLVVQRAEFGVLETTPEGEERFVPMNELPAVEGTTFGWVLQVETQRESLHWQEHLRLPKAPVDWGDAGEDPDVLIARDGKSVAAHGEDAIADGELTRFYWTLSSGDPAGNYELDVAIEGRTVAQFRFRVPTPVQEQAILVSNPRSTDARAMRVSNRVTRGGAERVAAVAGPVAGAPSTGAMRWK